MTRERAGGGGARTSDRISGYRCTRRANRARSCLPVGLPPILRHHHPQEHSLVAANPTDGSDPFPLPPFGMVDQSDVRDLPLQSCEQGIMVVTLASPLRVVKTTSQPGDFPLFSRHWYGDFRVRSECRLTAPKESGSFASVRVAKWVRLVLQLCSSTVGVRSGCVFDLQGAPCPPWGAGTTRLRDPIVMARGVPINRSQRGPRPPWQ
jgi:hypothetical protein